MLRDWLLSLDTYQHQLSEKWHVDTFLPTVQKRERSSGNGRTLGTRMRNAITLNEPFNLKLEQLATKLTN